MEPYRSTTSLQPWEGFFIRNCSDSDGYKLKEGKFGLDIRRKFFTEGGENMFAQGDSVLADVPAHGRELGLDGVSGPFQPLTTVWIHDALQFLQIFAVPCSNAALAMRYHQPALGFIHLCDSQHRNPKHLPMKKAGIAIIVTFTIFQPAFQMPTPLAARCPCSFSPSLPLLVSVAPSLRGTDECCWVPSSPEIPERGHCTEHRWGTSWN